MKNLTLIFVVLMIIISSTGCMTVNLGAEGYDKTASLTSAEKKFTIVEHFKKHLKGWFTLFDLITISNPNIGEFLNKETISAHGDAVVNIKIEGQTTFIDGLIPFTLEVIGSIAAPPGGAALGALISSRTYTIEGDVIKYTEQ